MLLIDYVSKIRENYKDSAKNITISNFKDYNELENLVNEFIKKYKNKIIANRCHVIAMMLAKEYKEQIQYVEGYASNKWLDTKIILPVQHAWNKWQDIYFDLSAEIVFKINFDEYVLLTEEDLSNLNSNNSSPILTDDLLFGYHMLDRLKL